MMRRITSRYRTVSTCLKHHRRRFRGPDRPHKFLFCGQILSKREYTVLGIETSCDDTAAAVVRSDGNVLSDVVSSQWELHETYQGVHPMMASREHEKNLPHVVDAALERSGAAPDAVAVTTGPGLALCLSKGVEMARRISRERKIPLISVNHLEAHILVPMLNDQNIRYPFLALVASGGHTMTVLAESHGKYTRLGTTRDDAAGEAFDKVARLLRLTEGVMGHGGSALERAAREGDPGRCETPLPVPMMRSLKQRTSCDFSFSGLKTAVLYATRDEKEMTSSKAKDYAAAFQDAAVRHMVDRTSRALEICRERRIALSSVVISGGVAANEALRISLAALAQRHALHISFPPVRLCTDNGVMVAWAALEGIREGTAEPLRGDAAESVQIRARWPVGM